MYQYPYGDSQQLNLDWIINKLIELSNEIDEHGSDVDLEEVANALISLTYIPTNAYNNSDIVFHDGHLYRCNTTIPAPGEVWDPAHWDQIMLGNTVANLVRAVAGMNSDHVFNESNVPGTHVTEALNALVEDVRYDNHKIQQKKNGSYTDIIPVEDTPSNNSNRLASSKAVYALKSATFSGIALFNRFGVVGDSFASGESYLNGALTYQRENAWCKVIANKVGNTAIEYAGGGVTTRRFVDSTHEQYNNWYMGKLLADITNNKKCGLYIIALGINDVALGSSYLGSASDIHQNDPSLNADTFYGNYGKIISTIKSNNPVAKIICSTFHRPTSGSTEETLYPQFNAAIKAIANLFSIPCIDLTDDDYFNSDYYMQKLVSRHPTQAQYVGYAEAMMRLIGHCIIDNDSYFNSYYNDGVYNDNYYSAGEYFYAHVVGQYFGVAPNATTVRVLIPLLKPVRAAGFTVTGSLLLRGGGESTINATIVESNPSAGECTISNTSITEDGVAFIINFPSSTVTARQVYGIQGDSPDYLTVTFT